MTVCKMVFLFNWVICMFHVKFPDSRPLKNASTMSLWFMQKWFRGNETYRNITEIASGIHGAQMLGILISRIKGSL